MQCEAGLENNTCDDEHVIEQRRCGRSFYSEVVAVVTFSHSMQSNLMPSHLTEHAPTIVEKTVITCVGDKFYHSTWPYKSIPILTGIR